MRVRATLRWMFASVAEMGAPANRPRLVQGVRSGYAVALGFLLLAVALSVFDLTGWRWVYFALVGGKLATNTLAWLALARRRGVLAAPVTNSALDLVVPTCG